MYLKLLDSIIAEEFQNDRRVYIMQSEKKTHNGELVIELTPFYDWSQINQGWLSKSLGICFRIKMTKGNNSSERL